MTTPDVYWNVLQKSVLPLDVKKKSCHCRWATAGGIARNVQYDSNAKAFDLWKDMTVMEVDVVQDQQTTSSTPQNRPPIYFTSDDVSEIEKRIMASSSQNFEISAPLLHFTIKTPPGDTSHMQEQSVREMHIGVKVAAQKYDQTESSVQVSCFHALFDETPLRGRIQDIWPELKKTWLPAIKRNPDHWTILCVKPNVVHMQKPEEENPPQVLEQVTTWVQKFDNNAFEAFFSALIFADRKSDLGLILGILRQHHEICVERNSEGSVPLHLAASLYTPGEKDEDPSEHPVCKVYKLMLDIYPYGARIVNKHLRYPLHYAAEKGVPVPALELLLKANPDAVMQDDEVGWLPMHYAARCNVPAAVIVKLIDVDVKANSEAKSLQTPDKNGWLALHHAARTGASKEVVEELIKAYPGALKVENRLGQRPLAVVAEKASDELKDLLNPDTKTFKAVAQPLRIRITSARDLRDADHDVTNLGNKSDPYCSVEIMDKPESKARTPTAQDTLEPVWEAEVVVPGYLPGDRLIFNVWDEDAAGTSDLLGSVILNNEDFNTPGGYDGELPLTSTVGAIKKTLSNQPNTSYLKVRVHEPHV
jgi:ankyrin repeat protein